MTDLEDKSCREEPSRETGDRPADETDPATCYSRGPHDTPSLKPSSGLTPERALAVVETLLGAGNPISLQEIAARLDLPRQTANRIVNQLIDAGLIQRRIYKDRITLRP